MFGFRVRHATDVEAGAPREGTTFSEPFGTSDDPHILVIWDDEAMAGYLQPTPVSALMVVTSVSDEQIQDAGNVTRFPGNDTIN